MISVTVGILSALVALTVLNMLLTVAQVGKVRQPIEAPAAAVACLLYLLQVVAYLYLFTHLS